MYLDTVFKPIRYIERYAWWVYGNAVCYVIVAALESEWDTKNTGNVYVDLPIEIINQATDEDRDKSDNLLQLEK